MKETPLNVTERRMVEHWRLWCKQTEGRYPALNDAPQALLPLIGIIDRLCLELSKETTA